MSRIILTDPKDNYNAQNESVLLSFSLDTVWFVIFLQKNIGTKAARKMLMILTTRSFFPTSTLNFGAKNGSNLSKVQLIDDLLINRDIFSEIR